jgi:rhodanese-related sulfurtransferase
MATQAMSGSTVRMSAADLKARMEKEPVTVIDVRSPKTWQESNEKIRGAVRAQAHDFRPDSSWPKNRLIAAYCT